MDENPMTTHLDHQPEPERRPGPRRLDLRVCRHAGVPLHGAAYGFDEDELARLLAEASRTRLQRSTLEGELEKIESSALGFL